MSLVIMDQPKSDRVLGFPFPSGPHGGSSVSRWSFYVFGLLRFFSVSVFTICFVVLLGFFVSSLLKLFIFFYGGACFWGFLGFTL